MCLFFPRWSGDGHAHRDHSSTPFLCLFFSFVFFRDQSSFHNGYISAFPNTVFSSTSQVILTLGGIPASLAIETEPRHTSYLQGMTLVFHHSRQLRAIEARRTTMRAFVRVSVVGAFHPKANIQNSWVEGSNGGHHRSVIGREELTLTIENVLSTGCSMFFC